MEYKTKFCIVGSRPVKGVRNSEGGLGIYAFNWETGEFEINYDYMQRIYIGDIDNGETVEVTEEEFNAYVEKLRKGKEKGLD
ncbi:hypothetical protein C8D70_12016 [Chryseobacterium sp. CBTAP 102]|uniref:hypothetical protein n=1 Tax=Chryseobacterium sp. CBTAP 102 TaxID=2135644 RepID=UPI000D7523BF|nr:hypothetical protein [Chryseobacterium sp. CBTAP 102]PXW07786.1 hypothetical protein C8D70_12016 [Chryseobacterium sp. CBTAP 102]